MAPCGLQEGLGGILREWNAFVRGWLHGGRYEFCKSDAGEDEQGAGGAAAAEAFDEKQIRSEPGEDGLESEDERGVGGGKVALHPGLHGKSDGGGEDGGDKQGNEQAGRPA